MKTVRFAILITLLVIILLACVLVFSAKYFSWRKKDGTSIERTKKIQLVALGFIVAATIGVVLVLVIR